jgi:scyllo-inositol 2-dehydrogenase (NADP+)
MAEAIRGAVIGYGPAFNMGKHHASQMENTEGIECVAICDIDRARTRAAKKDFPDVNTYNSVRSMLKKEDFDLASVVLPHNLHAEVAIECLKVGKNVIVEKPMCITIAEATEMINTAKENKVMLSVYHNRRWDRDFWTLKELVESGVIGKVFQVEMWGGGYGRPNPDWWRSNKKVSGGAMYDWGAHYLDWLLNIMPAKMVNVTGLFHPNRVWKDISNEDHVQAIIRFADDAVADVQMSNIAKVGKPRWRVLGEKGAIVPGGRDRFKVYSVEKGWPEEQEVEYKGRPGPGYYQNIVAHLKDGEELIVKPEEARRVIAVMELSEKSSRSHQAEPVPYE